MLKFVLISEAFAKISIVSLLLQSVSNAYHCAQTPLYIFHHFNGIFVNNLMPYADPRTACVALPLSINRQYIPSITEPEPYL
jgi:hypothetical protein